MPRSYSQIRSYSTCPLDKPNGFTQLTGRYCGIGYECINPIQKVILV